MTGRARTGKMSRSLKPVLAPAKLRLAMKHALFPLLALVLGSLAAPVAAQAPRSSARPNVLFLFADDQRADTIAALGNPVIKTPNLDRLARAGLSFSRAYMQGGMNGATCVPSRAMLLSGRSLFHIDEKLMRDETWPAAFGRAGYATFMSGKWHNGEASLPRSFQMARSVFAGGMTDPLKANLSDLVDGRLTKPSLASKHACAAFADEAIRFLREHKGGPFFCYVPFDAPHDPHIVPEGFPIQYDPAQIALPPNFLPQHPFDNGEMVIRDELLLPWPRTPQAVRAYLAEYYRYVSYLDAQIGRVLDALDASPFATNTIVVFSADSGVACGSHGLIGKQNLYEFDSVRVPLLISGPGIPAGRTTDAMCYLFDVLPTLGKLCDVPAPKTSEGLDLSATLKNPATRARAQLLFAYQRGPGAAESQNAQRAVRDERWKLIRYPRVDKTQLFDLATDPQETTNLADDSAYAGKVKKLFTLLKQQQRRFGDAAPLFVADPKPAAWSPPSPGTSSAPLPASRSAAAESPPGLPSTWPQAYSVRRDKAAGWLTLSTPYYQVRHDLKQGGAISSIRLIHGQAANLLMLPFETRVQDATGKLYSDLAERSPRVTIRQDGLKELVTVESDLRDAQGKSSDIRVKTVYEYRWGYVKIHKELTFPGAGFRAQDICPVSTVLAPSLSAYGYRDGLTEQEGSPPFSFGSCHWGNLNAEGTPAIDAPFIPRYVMFADPGVEGLEWFVSSDLAQWDLQLTHQRGQGKSLLQARAAPAGALFSVSPFQNRQSPVLVPSRLTFDYYLGLPLLEGHALKPWFHSSFNRNRGDWIGADQLRSWIQTGIQTVHCHNDGDYYDDGLFWRDGAYPPYPDMDKYDRAIADCHRAGIRVATYFSNKELHPSTLQFQQHGSDWGRMNRKGDLQHNTFKGNAEFGVQMCLHSGWLESLKTNIDRVLTGHPLDGVYYDWNVALLCCNPRHEKLQAGQPASGHWDIDELLDLMEWTRHRVGPRGLVIIHNTTTPMFATENFANDIVANEWGYGKWSGQGPKLEELPLEWSLVGARSRGVISYGQLDAQAPRGLHRLFALEALLAGVTPWPASPETAELFPVLKPIGPLESCRFADWRNQAVTLRGARSGSAIYSRPDESWLVLGNLEESAREVQCLLRPDKLPYPLPSIISAALFSLGSIPTNGSDQVAPLPLDVRQLTGKGVSLTLPPNTAVLLRVR